MDFLEFLNRESFSSWGSISPSNPGLLLPADLPNWSTKLSKATKIMKDFDTITVQGQYKDAPRTSFFKSWAMHESTEFVVNICLQEVKLASVQVCLLLRTLGKTHVFALLLTKVDFGTSQDLHKVMYHLDTEEDGICMLGLEKAHHKTDTVDGYMLSHFLKGIRKAYNAGKIEADEPHLEMIDSLSRNAFKQLIACIMRHPKELNGTITLPTVNGCFTFKEINYLRSISNLDLS